MQSLSSSQASPEVPINENFITVRPSELFGVRQPVTTGLTWGYYGGQYNSQTIADGTVTLTTNTTNYVVATRTTGVVSTATTTTNWNDYRQYIRLYTVTTNVSSVITGFVDHRDFINNQYNGMVYAGMRNRITNGDMAIDQRNEGAARTFTAAAALAYCVDRWYGYCAGANVTGQRVAGGAGTSQFRYQFTGAASVTGIQFGQRISQRNSYDLSNNVVTITAELANSLLTSVTWALYYATTANSFGTIAAPTRTQIATGTFTVNSTLATYSTTIAAATMGASSTTGLELVLSVGAQTSGTWTIGRVSLEKGPAVLNMEQRPEAIELELCQRHYQKTYRGVVPATVTSVGALSTYTPATSNYASMLLSLPTEMHSTTPTLTIYNPLTGATASIDAAGTGVAAAGLASHDNLRVNVNNVSVAADTLIAAHYTLESEL